MPEVIEQGQGGRAKRQVVGPQPPRPPPRDWAAQEQKVRDSRRRFIRSASDLDSKIIVEMAFDHLEYVKITQQPSMTFSTFIGNIGGQAGLWLGASIITLVKLILMLIPWVESFLVRVCGWKRGSHALDASSD